MKSEKKYYGYVYLTTNLINNKKYIGQHRGEPNDSYFGSGIYIKQAIKKYGKENFKKEILCYADSQEELNKLEIEFITLHNAVEDEMYYNIALGGYTPVAVGGMKGKKHTEETKQKLRELNLGENNPNFGKCGELNPGYGKPRSEETKRKISETRIKLGLAKGENNPMYGKRHTEESRRKMSESLKGRVITEETRQKISKRSKEQYASGERNNGSEKLQKPVRCITTGKEFSCAKEAAKYYQIKSHGSINKCCRGCIKSAGKLEDGTKLQWEYIE